jgi:BirA family biotin operon repressor/biotin-[acetyl-CoA-carboxylase] ligase
MTYEYESDAINLKKNLYCERIGSNIIFLPEIDSTNDLIKKYLINNVSEGLVVVAEAQTGGRGRRGRSWHSPPETGVYLSTLLKPDLEMSKLSIITLLAGVAAILTINEFSNQNAYLKWPNDILIDSKKVCGLLCEMIKKNRAPNGVIIGIGINVNQVPEQFPDHLKNIATSIRTVNGFPIDRLAVIQSFLTNLDREYQAYLNEGENSVIKKWSLNTKLFGKKVSIKHGSNITTGSAMRLDELGRLVLLLDNGHEEAFDSGEVSLRED